LNNDGGFEKIAAEKCFIFLFWKLEKHARNIELPSKENRRYRKIVAKEFEAH
jgi:hypothetical protein